MDNLKSAAGVIAVILWPYFVFSDILCPYFCVVTEMISCVFRHADRWLIIIFYSFIFVSLFCHSTEQSNIHKSVKQLKNSQQIHYSTYHDNSYADRERNSPSLFYIFNLLRLFLLRVCEAHCLCVSTPR
jgi:hypothetical protein